MQGGYASGKRLKEFHVSFIGEDDARTYLVEFDEYDKAFKAVTVDGDELVTFKPYGFTRPVTFRTRAIMRVKW